MSEFATKQRNIYLTTTMSNVMTRFQAIRYEECFCTELLQSWTAKCLESSPPNLGVDGSNPRGLKCDN